MDFQVIADNLPLMWEGFQMTVELFALTSVAALLLAVPVAMCLISRYAWARLPFAWGVRFLRGTPSMVQLFILYYGLAQFDWLRDSWAWPILRSAYWCALIGLILNSTAYNAHILRGAILAVPAGQIEAGRACGMSGWTIYRCITLPAALRLALPALGNELIKNMKRTAIASTITINELTGTASLIVSRTLAPYEIFATAALFYLLLTFVVTRAVNWLERRLAVGTAPTATKLTLNALETP